MKHSYDYKVFYILKHRYSNDLRHIQIQATNQKEAIRLAREAVYEKTGRYAFHVTPIRSDCPDDVAERKMQDLYWYVPSAIPET